jgi:hypothetical protein
MSLAARSLSIANGEAHIAAVYYGARSRNITYADGCNLDPGFIERVVHRILACHGDQGEGNGEIPRLAGQHTDYLKTQLEDFRSLVRNNDVMHANTKDMTNREIEAVVSYLANE